MLRLRHRAIVHVYENETVADDLPWHSDLIFGVATENGWKVGSAVHRLQVAPEMVARFRRQIPIARTILYERFQERMSQLTSLMNSLSIDSEKWISSFFDPVAVFGSEAAVREVLAGVGQGLASFYTSDRRAR